MGSAGRRGSYGDMKEAGQGQAEALSLRLCGLELLLTRTGRAEEEPELDQKLSLGCLEPKCFLDPHVELGSLGAATRWEKFRGKVWAEKSVGEEDGAEAGRPAR